MFESGRQHHRTASDCVALKLVSCILFILFSGPALSTSKGLQSDSSAGAPLPASVVGESTANLAPNKEKTALEIEKLRIENVNAERSLSTTRGWLNLLYGNVTGIVAILLAFSGLIKYLRERREELAKRVDERFEEIVKGLGSEQEQQRINSAVLLPTFLRKDYERFYAQVFNLAAGNLRGRNGSGPSALYPPAATRGSLIAFAPPPDHASSSDSAFTHALSAVFRESYPLARDSLKVKSAQEVERQLNAANVKLDKVFLARADLSEAWLRSASFREAKLVGANLTDAVLEEADLHGADLTDANLRGANLKAANFTSATLENAYLLRTRIDRAVFVNANLAMLNMTGGAAGGANFSNANISKATFRNVDFGPPSPYIGPANIEDAADLQDARFIDVTGLTDRQIEKCRKKGAYVEARFVAPASDSEVRNENERAQLPPVPPRMDSLTSAFNLNLSQEGRPKNWPPPQ